MKLIWDIIKTTLFFVVMGIITILLSFVMIPILMAGKGGDGRGKHE